MPDLFVDWNRAAPIETVNSPAIGTVRAPYDCWRTGDHRPGGLLLVRGPGLPAGRPLPRMLMEDLPVTIAARLGVVLDDVDGVADSLARRPACSAPRPRNGARERHS